MGSLRQLLHLCYTYLTMKAELQVQMKKRFQTFFFKKRVLYYYYVNLKLILHQTLKNSLVTNERNRFPKEGEYLVSYSPALCKQEIQQQIEALTGICPMDSTMGIGNVQNDTKSFIHFWQDLLEMQMEKSDFKFLDFSSRIKPGKYSNQEYCPLNMLIK